MSSKYGVCGGLPRLLSLLRARQAQRRSQEVTYCPHCRGPHKFKQRKA